MLANMFNKLFEGFSPTGSDRVSSARKSRPDRRYSLCQGMDRLEGRLSPSVAIAPFMVTVTNTDPTPTYEPDQIV